MSFLSPERLKGSIPEQFPQCKEKITFFQKNFQSLINTLLQWKKGFFAATRPGHREPSTKHPASLFEFFIFIFQRNLRNQRLKYLLR
jgi:hypothetical protein